MVSGPPFLAAALAGQNNYLGHLVAAAIAVDEQALVAVTHLARQRAASRSRLGAGLYEQLMAIVPTEFVSLPPLTYNRMAARMTSPERIGAWACEKALANLLKAYPTYDSIALAKALPRAAVQEQMGAHGHRLHFYGDEVIGQRQDAVKAAQALAELRRRQGLVALAEELALDSAIPRSSTKELAWAQRFYDEHGMAGLGQVAKLHLDLTEVISGSS